MKTHSRKTSKKHFSGSKHKLLIWIIVLLIAGATGYMYLNKNTSPSHADADLNLYVSTLGNDSNPGTIKRPLRSIHQALALKGELSASALAINIVGPSYLVDKKDYVAAGYQIPNRITEGSVSMGPLQSAATVISGRQTTIYAESPVENISFFVGNTGTLKIGGLRFTVGLVAQASGRDASIQIAANDFSLAWAPDHADADLDLSCSNSSYCRATKNTFTIFNGPFGDMLVNALNLNSYGSASIDADWNTFKYPATEDWPDELNPPGPGGYQIRGIVSWGSSPSRILGNTFVSDKFNGKTGFLGYVGISYSPSAVVGKNSFTKFSGIPLDKRN
jgi:hypothetical protein